MEPNQASALGPNQASAAKRDRTTRQDAFDVRQSHLAGRQAGRQAGLARDLWGAVDRDELHLDYQPVVEVITGEITGLEALLRWTHPSRGPISPTIFIPFAEQSGQIIGLGRWVLEQACADRHFWQRHSATNITMSVNISTHQFMSAGLAQTVAKALIDTSTDPSLLTLEVTESVLVQDETRALVVFGELKQTGVKLALDDFGTGYSSLRYFDTMPIDIVKVDQSFVTKLPDQPRSREIVGAIVELAHGIGMTVVAEGVETAEQQHELAELGVDLCQGFYFALPMRREPVDSLIRVDVGGTRLPTSQPG